MTLIDFRPRSDNLELHDQQVSLFHSQHPGVTWILHGNGAGGTTLAVAKMLRFLQVNPPLEHNMPFVVLDADYSETALDVWDKCLDFEDSFGPLFDKQKIIWKEHRRNIPRRVPLTVRENGFNWCIDFATKWENHSATDIGGFLITGQPKWGLLQEILRCTREHPFSGNKIVEMTPLPRKPDDPKYPLQEMDESGSLPDGWAIYHMSTQAARNAGQISKQWFDAFFTITDPAEYNARTWGAWPENPSSL